MDGKTYEAIENPDDSHRSRLEGLQLAEDKTVKNTFDPVRVLARHRTSGEYSTDDDILELVSIESGKVILEVGTRDTSDYYPYCVMSFNLNGV